MAKKVTLEIDVDSTGAVKNLKQVQQEAENLAVKSAESTKKASTSFAQFAGNLVKSLGIVTLLAKAFDVIREAIGQNQKSMDFFNTLFGTLATIVRDFVTFVIENFGKVVDFFKQVFENPIESIKKLGDLIKENLIERFNSSSFIKLSNENSSIPKRSGALRMM